MHDPDLDFSPLLLVGIGFVLLAPFFARFLVPFYDEVRTFLSFE